MAVRLGHWMLAVGMAMTPAAASAEAPNWRIDPASSRIAVSTTQMGAKVAGEFRRFEADIRFDPEDLAASRVVVTIDPASLDTGNDERDATARTAPWFDVAAHPVARFQADSFRALGGARYEAEGTLTIKGTERPAVLPFSLDLDGDRARVTGGLAVERAAFGLGTGEWLTNGIVGDSVEIRVEVSARRDPG